MPILPRTDGCTYLTCALLLGPASRLRPGLVDIFRCKRLEQASPSLFLHTAPGHVRSMFPVHRPWVLSSNTATRDLRTRTAKAQETPTSQKCASMQSTRQSLQTTRYMVSRRCTIEIQVLRTRPRYPSTSGIPVLRYQGTLPTR